MKQQPLNALRVDDASLAAPIVARYFRYAFVRRFVKPSHAVLDLGCGPDAMLATVLWQRLDRVPRRYVGVDRKEITAQPFTWTEFNPILANDQTFDVITIDGISRQLLQYLTTARAVLKEGGVALLRMPQGAALEIRKTIEKTKFKIVDRFGVGARWKDIQPLLTHAEALTLERLRSYYDDDAAACLVAPLYPDHALETVLVLHRDDEPDVGAAPTPPHEQAKRGRGRPRKDTDGIPPANVAQLLSRGHSAVPPQSASGSRRPGAGVSGGARKNAKRQTCGERIRELLDSRGCVARCRNGGGHNAAVTIPDEEAILKVVRAEFPWSTAKRSDIVWNLRKLVA